MTITANQFNESTQNIKRYILGDNFKVGVFEHPERRCIIVDIGSRIEIGPDTVPQNMLDKIIEHMKKILDESPRHVEAVKSMNQKIEQKDNEILALKKKIDDLSKYETYYKLHKEMMKG